MELSKLVAVHLRRGDIVKKVCADDFDVHSYEGTKWMKFFVGRYIPFGSYYRQLEQMGHPDITIYSDVEKDAEAFASAYPGRAHLASKFLPSERTVSPLADSFLEFMMIGSSPVIIGSRHSLFSFYSAWLSNRTFIDMIETLRASEIIADVDSFFRLDGSAGAGRQEAGVEFLKHYRISYFSTDESEDAMILDSAISRWDPRPSAH